MSNDTNTVKDFELEQFLLKELPAVRMKFIEEALNSNEILAKKLDALKSDNASFLENENIEEALATIHRKARLENITERSQRLPSRHFLNWRLALAPTVALILVFVIILINTRILPNTSPQQIAMGVSTSANRIKGAPRLFIYAKRETQILKLQDGDTVKKGDLLQINYNSFGQKYGMIFSIDGNGVTTLHLPNSPGKAAHIDTKKKTALEYAYELDDAPEYERFYFITAQSEFNTDDILKNLSKPSTVADPASLSALPAAFNHTVMELRKE